VTAGDTHTARERAEALDEQREKWIDAFGRVYQYVPLSQYDEATKLAEHAFEEMMGENRALLAEREALRERVAALEEALRQLRADIAEIPRREKCDVNGEYMTTVARDGYAIVADALGLVDAVLAAVPVAEPPEEKT
jgi:regulator of replication initiation timing